MDRMSVISVVFASLPESVLVFIIILLICNNSNIWNFKDKMFVFKFLGVSVLSVLISSISRSFIPFATYNFIIMLILYSIITLVFFKSKFIPTILGTLLSFLILVIGDLIILSIVNIFNLSLNQIYSNDTLRILISLPTRIVQLTAIFIILRKKYVKFQINKLSINQGIQIALFFFMIVSSMLSIESGLREINRDTKTILHLMINILIALVFSFWAIYNIFRLKRKNLINEKIRDIELERIKKLIKEGCTEHVLELIDLTLTKRSVKS